MSHHSIYTSLSHTINNLDLMVVNNPVHEVEAIATQLENSKRLLREWHFKAR